VGPACKPITKSTLGPRGFKWKRTSSNTFSLWGKRIPEKALSVLTQPAERVI
jgi:hypothetical protein